MKCLSVRQPWAYLIMAGLKTIENRSRATRFRGRLAIHASARLDVSSWADVFDLDEDCADIRPEDALEFDDLTLPPLADLALGAILGTVEVTDCLAYDDLSASLKKDPFASGPVCWLLADPRPLAVPFPCKGALGLWNTPNEIQLL